MRFTGIKGLSEVAGIDVNGGLLYRLKLVEKMKEKSRMTRKRVRGSCSRRVAEGLSLRLASSEGAK